MKDLRRFRVDACLLQGIWPAHVPANVSGSNARLLQQVQVQHPPIIDDLKWLFDTIAYTLRQPHHVASTPGKQPSSPGSGLFTTVLGSFVLRQRAVA